MLKFFNVRYQCGEKQKLFKDMFKLYYKSLADHIQSKLTSCGEFFKSLPNQNSTEFQKGLGELCTDLKCIFKHMKCRSERTICGHILAILKHYAGYDNGEMEYAVESVDDKDRKQHVVYIDVWGRHGDFAIIFEVKFNHDATDEPGKIGSTKKSSLAAAEDIVELLPGKETAEGGPGDKAGTGRNLQVLKSPIEFKKYVLIGLAVDGDHTTHMLVFRDTSEWESVIQVNPEKHVAKLISTHVKLNKPVV
ncbi:hypothetical protein Zmor_005963 [Zophobas morio]|uniref:Uncharacterized protein n=1 Tax=Zophobas morio TaxID=2755281 RepID=A0AA38IWP0_9CUCU|nr:hypothetical protein Zmor_005963 [Zophobas morio]